MLANGLNIGLRQSVGPTREIVSTCHSISIRFDLAPVGAPAVDFRALTYCPERAADRMAYLTLFPIGATMRAVVSRPVDGSSPFPGSHFLFLAVVTSRHYRRWPNRRSAEKWRLPTRNGAVRRQLANSQRAPSWVRYCSFLAAASASCFCKRWPSAI